MNGNSETEFKNVVIEDMRERDAAANLVFHEKVKSLIKSGRQVAHFAFGQSPFPAPTSFVKELQNHAHIHAYLPIQGLPELRGAVSAFHSKYDNVTLGPEHFIVGPGSKELIYLTINAFNGVVLLPSPTWLTYEQQCHQARKDPLVLNTDSSRGWKVTPECLLKGLKCLSSSSREGFKLLVLTNPGNPTGVCYTDQELQELSDICRQNQVLVLSDEIYSRLTFGESHSSMLKHYPEGTIMTSGFSKWASVGGWRIGYAYFPPELKSLKNAVLYSVTNTFSCAPAPMQYAVAKALQEDAGELDRYISDCRSILRLVSEFCAKELAMVGVRGQPSEAGYYFMPDFEPIREGLRKRGVFTGDQMTEAILNEADVALMSSHIFLGSSTDLSVRFCFVCFDGAKALKNFRDYKDQGIILEASNVQGQMFMEENCQVLVQGLQRLKEWVLKHKD